jgi:hypothetical protein
MGHLINPISFRLGYSRNWGFSGALMESKSQYFYLNNNYWNIFLFFRRIFSLQIFEKMGIIFSHMRYLTSYNENFIILYLYDGPWQNESFIFYKYLIKYKRINKILKSNRFFFKKFYRRAFFTFYFLKNLDLFISIFLNLLGNYIKQKLINLKKKLIFF